MPLLSHERLVNDFFLMLGSLLHNFVPLVVSDHISIVPLLIQAVNGKNVSKTATKKTNVKSFSPFWYPVAAMHLLDLYREKSVG